MHIACEGLVWRTACERLRATARIADGIIRIVGGAVACDQHEISVVEGISVWCTFVTVTLALR
jgi:hypothetical protein